MRYSRTGELWAKVLCDSVAVALTPADVVNADFPTPRGLRIGHLQSVRNRVRPPRFDLDALATARTILVPTDDDTGDRLAVTIHRRRAVDAGRDPHSDAERLRDSDSRGLVLLVHGLGGSAESVYIRASAAGLLAAGFNVARVDLRCAGLSRQTTANTYHAGKSEDLRAVLRVLAQRPEALPSGSDGPSARLDAEPRLAVMGFSLGGAMTLKLLGEPLAGLPVVAGVAVSAPLDLVEGSDHISGALFGAYERAIVRTLIDDAMTPAPDGSPRLSPTEQERVLAARTLPEFDNALTAPRHGWRDAYEYYQVNSAGPYLSRIGVPTLVIHSLDDPMIPAGPYLAVDWGELERSGPVRRAITAHGGHVGFHERGNPMPWYVGRAVDFLVDRVGEPQGG